MKVFFHEKREKQLFRKKIALQLRLNIKKLPDFEEKSSL
jgi:hypothetical protein